MQKKKYSSVERLFNYVFKDFHIIITSLNKILLLINDSTISGCVLVTSYKSGSYPGGYFPRYRSLPGRSCRTSYPGYPYPGACRPGHPGCPYCYRYPYKSGLLFSYASMYMTLSRTHYMIVFRTGSCHNYYNKLLKPNAMNFLMGQLQKMIISLCLD